MKWLYLLIDICTVIVPFVFSFHPRLCFYQSFKAFFAASVITSIFFIAWDILFTRLKVWGFNPKYISGIYFFGLPIEEVLFFICIPFACVFTYHCFTKFFNLQWKIKTRNAYVLILCTLLLITGIFNYNKLYTSSTFISLALVLVALNFFIKVSWLDKLLIIYPVLLIPFFIVNGILTGTGLHQPVVWYNDHQNLGLRLFTIPVEDIFYGFELILLNIFLYEFFKRKFKNIMK